MLIFSYPVQYSNVPKILYDFVTNNQELWKNKKVFVIATMALFSGDGAGVLARMLKRYGAVIIGGLHVILPDSIADVKVLKRSYEKSKKLVEKGKKKINKAVYDLKNDNPPQEGLSILSHVIGLCGQRLFFLNKTKHFVENLKINPLKCIGCGRCKGLCPMNNITIENRIAVGSNKCTMCYRCINNCPKQAITLLGKKVVEQSIIEKYIS